MKTILPAMAIASTTLFLSLPATAAQVSEVVFESEGEHLVGNLYLPDDYQEGDELPGAIVTGAWTTVKEQMPATYAEQLADRGFAALTFDFRNWGESEGERRQLESPTLKTEDIQNAARFMATLPEVDETRIGGLGICASSGYMAGAVADTPELSSLALVAPWLHDAEIVNEVYGGESGVSALIETSRQAEAVATASGELQLVPAASNTDENAIMFQVPYYTEPERGMIPEWRNQFNLESWELWLTYDAIEIADRLDEPTLIVHSSEAAIPEGARTFLSRLNARKDSLWLEGTTQFDFYDDPESVRQAVDAVAEHFEETL